MSGCAVSFRSFTWDGNLHNICMFYCRVTWCLLMCCLIIDVLWCFGVVEGPSRPATYCTSGFQRGLIKHHPIINSGPHLELAVPSWFNWGSWHLAVIPLSLAKRLKYKRTKRNTQLPCSVEQAGQINFLKYLLRSSIPHNISVPVRHAWKSVY